MNKNNKLLDINYNIYLYQDILTVQARIPSGFVYEIVHHTQNYCLSSFIEMIFSKNPTYTGYNLYNYHNDLIFLPRW